LAQLCSISLSDHSSNCPVHFFFNRSVDSMNRFPVYFISHGAPNLILQKQDPTFLFLQNLGQSLQKSHIIPAILMISAHWEEPTFTVTTNEWPETIHDFGGFEDVMYSMRYPAKTSQILADRCVSLLEKAKMNPKRDPKRGFDHGNWSPLMVMFPEANIPIVQVSLKIGLNIREHIEAGKALAALREEGYLIIASGGATHNLGAMFAKERPSWATDFEQCLTRILEDSEGEERAEALSSIDKHSFTRKAHPRIEHLVPVAVAAGIGGKAKKIHSDWLGTLSLSAFEFE